MKSHKYSVESIVNHQFSTAPFNMYLRLLIASCLIATLSAVTLEICQYYCSAQQGVNSYANCSPWKNFAHLTNQTCYNLCVSNCYYVYDGSCMSGNNFRCCLATTPQKKQEFIQSGCSRPYNNL